LAFLLKISLQMPAAMLLSDMDGENARPFAKNIAAFGNNDGWGMPMMISIAIVEDEPEQIRVLTSYLERYEQEHDVHFHISSFSGSLAFLNDVRTIFDIVFMDIEMPYKNGMEAAAEMRRLNTESCLIFVTNMAQYAVKGYEVDAMDFLVKPVPYSVFSFKLAKAISRVEKRSHTELTIRLKNGIVRLQVSDIRYVQVDQHRIFYHTSGGRQEAWGSLLQAEENLKPFGFSRCSSNCLVNLRCVSKVINNEVYLGDEVVSLSRGKKKQFMADLTQYLGA